MDFGNLLVKLPIGKQHFAAIRRRGLVYVDKTLFVYKIARKKRPIIVTRPRRFGKSTLQSTLEELFLHGVAPYDGHDSYFKGLAIEQLWQDQGHYLVLHLDLYKLNSMPINLRNPISMRSNAMSLEYLIPPCVL